MKRWAHEWTRALKDLDQAINVPTNSQSLCEMVWALYENDLYPREYHNSNHIFTGVDLLDEFEAETNTPLMPIVRYAWMMHDAKCVPGEKNNEECSAFLACTIISSQLAENPILSTKPSFEGSTIAGRIIRDVDWAYFGYQYEEFEHITTLVRTEYSAFSDDEWKVGRKAFLESIDPEKVFWNSYFKKKYDAQVRINLEKSIANLS